MGFRYFGDNIQDGSYSLVDELVIYKGRIYLILGLDVREIILQAFHDSPMASHPGFFKTYRQFLEKFTWKGLKSDVHRYVRRVFCLLAKQT